MSEQSIVEVTGLHKHFPIKKGLTQRVVGHIRAVDGVSFTIKRGQTLGIIGESGSGKTTVGRTMLRLTEPTSGRSVIDGVDIFHIKRSELRKMRPRMQIIFQDPYSSLNPRMPVGRIIGEAVREHRIVPKRDVRDYVHEVMESCGLHAYQYSRYPHEFSGGQRQRICIARALALGPDVLVADEPVSSLDVSVQAQIINLLRELQRKRRLSYLFISHDLSVVEHISDVVGVMYLGKLVELAPTVELFGNSAHPYTRALLSAVPVSSPCAKKPRVILRGDIPSPINPPAGCKFHTRCPRRVDKCRLHAPELTEIAPGHMVACYNS